MTASRETLRVDPGRFTAGSAVSDPLGLLYAEEVRLAASEASATNGSKAPDYVARTEGLTRPAADTPD